MAVPLGPIREQRLIETQVCLLIQIIQHIWIHYRLTLEIKNHTKDRTEEDYVDACRFTNPDIIDYTFNTKNREQGAKLDITLLSFQLTSKTN